MTYVSNLSLSTNLVASNIPYCRAELGLDPLIPVPRSNIFAGVILFREEVLIEASHLLIPHSPSYTVHKIRPSDIYKLWPSHYSSLAVVIWHKFSSSGPSRSYSAEDFHRPNSLPLLLKTPHTQQDVSLHRPHRRFSNLSSRQPLR